MGIIYVSTFSDEVMLIFKKLAVVVKLSREGQSRYDYPVIVIFIAEICPTIMMMLGSSFLVAKA